MYQLIAVFLIDITAVYQIYSGRYLVCIKEIHQAASGVSMVYPIGMYQRIIGLLIFISNDF